MKKLNDLFGMTQRRRKGKLLPPPAKVGDVLLAIAERKARKGPRRVAVDVSPDMTQFNRAMKRANGDRGDRRHGNHPWNTRHVPRGKR